MSHDAAQSKTLPTSPDQPARLPLTPSIMVSIVGLFTFLATQVFVITGAAIWAIGGYLHLGLRGFSVLGGILVLPALFVCWKVLLMTIDAERDPANN